MSISLKDYFSSVVDQTEAFLKGYGYQRSGKSHAFYKISADKTAGCLILFRLSFWNTPDIKQFGINHIYLTSRDITGYTVNPKITVGLLKRDSALDGLSRDVFRIDTLLAECESSTDWFQETIKPKLERIVRECADLSGRRI